IGGWHVRRRKPELAPHDVTALGDGARLVESDLAVRSLTPETAVARYDHAFGRDVLQRLTDLGGHLFRPLCLKGAVADGADADLLLEIVLEGLEQLEVLLVAVLHFERPHIAPASLEINLNGTRVARVLH